MIFRKTEAQYFSRKGLDTISENQPVGQINSRLPAWPNERIVRNCRSRARLGFDLSQANAAKGAQRHLHAIFENATVAAGVRVLARFALVFTTKGMGATDLGFKGGRR
jgi:hypothetical protein